MAEINIDTPPTEEVEVKIDHTTVEILQRVEEWHRLNMDQINTLIEHGKEGVKLDMGGALQITLTAEMAKGFSIALHVAKSQFAVLPFTISPPADQPVTDAEVLDNVEGEV
jgi:hypothetical protein